MSSKRKTSAPIAEEKIYQTPIRMDTAVRNRLRTVCFHQDVSKQAFLFQAVLRAIEEAESELGLTRKARHAKSP